MFTLSDRQSVNESFFLSLSNLNSPLNPFHTELSLQLAHNRKYTHFWLLEKVLYWFSGGSRISQRGGANPWVWAENLLFAKTCMKMKEIVPLGTIIIKLFADKSEVSAPPAGCILCEWALKVMKACLLHWQRSLIFAPCRSVWTKLKTHLHWEKTNAKAKRIKVQSEEIKDKASNIKEKIRFRVRFRSVWTNPKA